ncbi:MAG: DoxX family protein [Cytophagales bacterium]|nr:DoxX family protein [Cytophagales bacterium]
MTTHSISTPQSTSKALHVTLWIAQVLLAAMFLMAGFMKSTQPIAQLSATLPWASQAPVGLVRFIGISEVLGAVGLVLPALLRIKPGLTVWAAVGIAVVMVLALVFHVVRGEFSAIGINLFMGLLAAFVAWGRSRQAPIQPK